MLSIQITLFVIRWLSTKAICSNIAFSDRGPVNLGRTLVIDLTYFTAPIDHDSQRKSNYTIAHKIRLGFWFVCFLSCVWRSLWIGATNNRQAYVPSYGWGIAVLKWWLHIISISFRGKDERQRANSSRIVVLVVLNLFENLVFPIFYNFSTLTPACC